MPGTKEPVPINELRVGDLVFLHPPPDDRLTEMIVKYDHGTFSHVGIVVEPGVMASSRTSSLSLGPDDQDYGGVRLNAVADLVARAPQIGRTMLTATEGLEGVTRTLDLLEYGVAHRSGFSFAKLFIVAAALDAVQEGTSDEARRAILVSSARAAKAWEASEQCRLGQQQSFFCSEAICVAYPSMSFTYGDFWTFGEPPPTETALPSADDLASLVRHLRSELHRYPSTGEQRAALWDVMRALVRHDFSFLLEVARAMIDFLGPHAEEDIGDLPDEKDPVPTSLVTPRMLHNAPWLEWVRPLARPA